MEFSPGGTFDIMSPFDEPIITDMNSYDPNWGVFDFAPSPNNALDQSPEPDLAQVPNAVKRRYRAPLTPKQRERRKEQNRKSQRAYRERRDQRVKELEAELVESTRKGELISTAYQELKAEYEALRRNYSRGRGLDYSSAASSDVEERRSTASFRANATSKLLGGRSDQGDMNDLIDEWAQVSGFDLLHDCGYDMTGILEGR
ncbi:hypothetical protein GQ53DRAFT_130281 [Thozetella sp. PMI_491]|nr:hypothetical protein GQ53DRAFT_130281 [Thozetella sp. PMI_491]